MLTVAIVNHDYGRFLKQAVESALAIGAEVMVSDDASTDDSLEVLKAFGDRVTAFTHTENDGRYCRGANEILDACTTEWIAFTSADDYVLPGFEKLCREGYDWVYCDVGLTDGETVTDVWDYRDWPTDWRSGLANTRKLLSVGVPHVGVQRVSWLRKNSLKYGQLDSTQIGDDAYTFTGWLLAKPRIAHVPEVLYHYRQHDASFRVTHEDEQETFRRDFAAYLDSLDLGKGRTVVWCLPAMRFFGELAADTLDCELMVGGYVGDCDTVHIVGLYDPPTYEHTLKMTARAKRRIIHWCGSDVLNLQDASVLPEATHVADSPQLVTELFTKDVDATCVMWPTKHHFEVTPLPEVPQVACYLGSDPAKYGNQMLEALSECLPDVKVVGYMFGQYTSEEMAQLVAESSVCVRLTKHDGSGASPREFMEAGRRAIVTHDLPHATVVPHGSLPKLVAAVRTALKASEPDLEAAEYWKVQNSVERFLVEMEAVRA